MKEIGKKLKLEREKTGISIEEASDDLKIEKNKIIAIEEGDNETFKDIYELKEYVCKYSKYLNIDVESIESEFNEFIFDFTCKIPVKEIAENLEKNETQIQSPYTIEKKNLKINLTTLISIIIIIIIGILIYLYIL